MAMFKGEILKKWRESKKLTQTEAASLIHVTQAFWTLLERGKTDPSAETLVALSGLTGISVDDLLGNPTFLPPKDAA